MRWALVSIAIAGLAAGIAAALAGRPALADLCWTLATLPVIAGLAVSMTRDLLAGRLGVDAIALVSMSAAVALGQPLAGAVVALMYSGGNVLEDIAVARAERDLRSLVDRAPREAHRLAEGRVEEVPISAVAIGDRFWCTRVKSCLSTVSSTRTLQRSTNRHLRANQFRSPRRAAPPSFPAR